MRNFILFIFLFGCGQKLSKNCVEVCWKEELEFVCSCSSSDPLEDLTIDSDDRQGSLQFPLLRTPAPEPFLHQTW